jgi:hypothetical protein
VITDLAVLDVTGTGFEVVELAPGVDHDEVVAKNRCTGAGSADRSGLTLGRITAVGADDHNTAAQDGFRQTHWPVSAAPRRTALIHLMRCAAVY